MNTEAAWSELFNSLPIEKRREIIVYSIHDEIMMIEREKIDLRNRYEHDLAELDKRISRLRHNRDRVWEEVCRDQQAKN